MTHQDMFGCETSVANAEALAAWNRTVHGFLAHAAWTGETLGKALASDQRFALGHACKGLFSLLLGRRELHAVARDAYRTAVEIDHENAITRRERHYIEALGAWIEGSPRRAIACMGKVLESFPQDALAMKLDHAIRFMLGDSKGMRKALEQLTGTYRNGHVAEGYFNGCYAFTLEETGEYRLAEEHGRKALELSPDDAWGFHAVQHVFDMTARAEEGLAWTEGKDEAWQHCNNFRYHVHWHNALLHLDLGHHDRVLSLYDTQIRQDKTDDYRDIANATSILLRLEFDGVHVGNRWDELANLASARTQDHCVAFADLHYMMALCNGPDETAATNLLSSMQSIGEKRHNDEMQAIVHQPGLLAATGLEAFRDHNFELAYNCLSKARPELQNIGGSHAQRDVFERLAIESALRGGLTSQARGLLRERDLHRGHRDGYSQSRWAALEGLNCTSGNTIDHVVADRHVA